MRTQFMKKSLLTAFAALLCAAGLSAPVSAASPAAIPIDYRLEYLSEWAPDGGGLLCSSVYPEIKVSSAARDQYPALEEALSSFSAATGSEAVAAYEAELTKAADERRENPDFFQPHTNEERPFIRRADDRAVSYFIEHSVYFGGAHGDTFYSAHSFDPESGAELTLDDVVTDRSALPELVKAQLAENYPTLQWDADAEQQLSAAMESPVWTVGYEGVTFYFGSYDIGTYADGPQNVTVPFAGNEDLFNEKYFDVPAVRGIQLQMHMPVSVDLDGDGTLERLSLGGAWDDQVYSSISVSVGDTSASRESYCYEVYGTLIRTETGAYVYAESSEDNDYSQLFIFDVTDGRPSFLGTYQASSYMEEGEDNKYWTLALTAPSDFILSSRYEMLSTLSASRHYCIDKDGMPLPTDSWYELNGSRELTLRSDQSLTLVDEVGKETGKETLPAGTKLTLIRTDNSSWTDARLEDGRIARIFVDAEAWPRLVDGTRAEEVFDGMQFAG